MKPEQIQLQFALSDLVERDLYGKDINESEYQKLYANPELWRDLLAKKLINIDEQFTKRRAESFATGTREGRILYEQWKASALKYKLAVVNRLKDVKQIIKTKNINDDDDKHNVFEEILSELKLIRLACEKK